MEWYVLRVRSGSRGEVQQVADRSGCSVFAPQGVRVVRHHRTKKRIKKEFDVFPGYAFLRAQQEDIGGIVHASSSIFGVLSTDGQPDKVNPEDMKRLFQLHEHGFFDFSKERDHNLNVGDCVEINVAGVTLTARVVGFNGRSRVSLEANAIGGRIRADRIGAELKVA